MAQFSGIYRRWVEKQQVVEHMMKAARCWEGYEPVPGKAPYSEDSCRPAGSKKKKTDKREEKKAAGSLFPSFAARKALGQNAMGKLVGPPKPQARPQSPTPAPLLNKASSLCAAIKLAASTVYKLTEKQPEEVVAKGKPSTESECHKVTRPEPAKSEDLRPEEAQPSKS